MRMDLAITTYVDERISGTTFDNQSLTMRYNYDNWCERLEKIGTIIINEMTRFGRDFTFELIILRSAVISLRERNTLVQQGISRSLRILYE